MLIVNLISISADYKAPSVLEGAFGLYNERRTVEKQVKTAKELKTDIF